MLINCQIWITLSQTRRLFSMWSTAVDFCGQRGSDQDDHERTKSDDETRVQNPQSCVRLVFWQNQHGPPKSKSNTSTPKTNSLTFWPKKISRLMSGAICFVCSTSWIFFFFSCRHFHAIKRGEHHVEEISGKRSRRRTHGVEIEVSLESRNPSATQSPSLDSGASYSPGSQEFGRNSVFGSVDEQVPDRVQNPGMNSPKRQCQASPEEFEDRIIFVSMFRRYRLDKEHLKNFEFREGQELRKVSAWTLVICRARRRKQMVWNAHLLTWRKVEWNFRCHGGNLQKRWTSDLARYSNAQSRNPEKKVEDVRSTSMRNLRMQSFVRTIHSANQLSVYGAVASWCEELAQPIPGQTQLSMENSVAKANEQLSQKAGAARSDSLVQTPRMNDGFYLRQFEDLSNEITKACERVGFMRRVSIGMYFQTVRCGWWFWRENASIQRAVITSWRSRFRNHCMDRWTHQTWSSFQVKTVCCSDPYGIETQVPPTSEDGSVSLVIFSRGLKSYVEGDTIHVLSNIRVLSKFVRDNQQHNRILWATIPKILFRLPKWSGMIFLLLRMQQIHFAIQRHLDQKERESDGGVRWKTDGSEATTRVSERRRTIFLILIGSIVFGKQAMILDFNIARTSMTHHSIFVPFKSTLEETWSRSSWWVMPLFHSDGRNSCFTWDAHSQVNPWSRTRRRRTGKPRVATNSFLHTLVPFWADETEEEVDNDLSEPRKVHCKSERMPHPEAVYWIHLATTQEKGLKSWQTRSRAIIFHDSVLADCIEKVVSLQENIFL